MCEYYSVSEMAKVMTNTQKFETPYHHFEGTTCPHNPHAFDKKLIKMMI
jgi:hypothetical protein